VTIGKVNISFQVALPGGHNTTDIEAHVLSVLLKALFPEASIVDFELLEGTQTKVDPFEPATVRNMPKPLALR